MLKIFFDHQIFSLQQYGGISRYFCELAKHLGSIEGVSPIIVPFLHQNKHLLEIHPLSVHSKYIQPPKKTALLRFVLNTVLFEVFNQCAKADIVHRTYYGKVLSGKAKQVTTIYDLIPEKHPKYFDDVKRFIRLKKESMLKSDHIICISNTTKQDLLEYYKIPESKISVIHLASSLAIEKNFSRQTISLERMGINKPYILYVGNRSGYKNFEILLSSYSKSKNLVKDFNLVCFGGPDFSKEELAEVTNLDLAGRVLYFSGNDDLLFQLYREANVFVFPSLYEGFGLPIIEAMSLGCPVACSRIDAFKEIANESAQFFDPKSNSSIRDTLEGVLYSGNVRQNSIKLGFENAMRFSWMKTANDTLTVYKSLLA